MLAELAISRNAQIRAASSSRVVPRVVRSKAMLVAVVAGSAFFVPAASASRAAAARPAVRMSSGGEDPTANPLIHAVNSLQEAMQNSPVANLKQSLAKMQAGDYDVDAVSARLNGLISDTPAVMFSFST